VAGDKRLLFMANLTGQSIGRYQVLERLGEGGMAVVYKATDTRLKRDVALKLIRVDQFGSAILEQILKRFEREAQSLARLSHPSIVTVYDYGEHDGAPYLVLEFCPGGDLKSRLSGKPMEWQQAGQLVLPIARALRYSHKQGVIHRDVKPSNIMFSGEGEPKLSDFGIAKILEHEEAATLTGTGVGIGTPGYMAPEQWTGETSPQSDQYGLGVVLYELLTGRKPYESDTPAGILIKQTSQPLPLPSVLVPVIPLEVEAALVKSLERDSAMRYADMAEFINVFEGLLQKTPVVDAKKIAVDEPETPIDPYRTLDMVPVVAASSRTLTPADWETTATPVPGKQRVNWKKIGIGGAVLVVLAGVIWGGMRFSKGFPAMVKPSETPTLAASATMTRIPSKTRTPTFTPTISPSSTSIPIAKPTPLGGGDRIGYASYESGKNEIYTMLPDGSQKTLLLNENNIPEGQFLGWSVDWSPDGSKIAFKVGDNDNNIQTYVMNLDGSESNQLNLPCKKCEMSGWFPDGERVLLSEDRPNVGSNKYSIMNLDGSGFTELLVQGKYVVGDAGISISPDGSKVAFVLNNGASLVDYLYVADSDFSNPVRLTPHTGWYENPVWLKVGEEMLYTAHFKSGPKEDSVEIRSIKDDGSNNHIIATVPCDTSLVEFSPDGKQALFPNCWVTQSGNWFSDGMRIIDLETGEINRPTNLDVGDAVWSPDGTKILFTGYNDDNSYKERDIYIINADGTGLVNLTNQPGAYSNLAWLPEP
jgi:serine/threonine protein kinase/Tol biopolymer transport system component